MIESNDKALEEIFYEMFDKLPRKGPGSFNSTNKAYNYVKPHLQNPQILDIGCGNGKQTLDLLAVSDGSITAMDNYKPFIIELNEALAKEELQHRAKAEVADMFDLPYADNSFDLLWCEGAIYNIGFEKGLKEFKRLLKPGGFIGLSEANWFVDEPSDTVFKFWDKCYPYITSIENNLSMAENAGYKNIAHFKLPKTDWIDEFYKYLSKRLVQLSRKYKDNPEALKLFDAERYEIDIYNKFSDEYGYVFYIFQIE